MMAAEETSFLLLLLWAHTVLSMTDDLKTKLISLPLDFIQTQEDLMGVKDVRLGPGSLLGENGYKEWSHVALEHYIHTKDLSIATRKGQSYAIYQL